MIDAHLPPPGTPTQPVEAGYMANAYVRMRHPDYDALRGMLDDVGRTVHVHAGVTARAGHVLGPQRRPTLDSVVRASTRRAGRDGHGGLAGARARRRRARRRCSAARSVNLRLYARWLDVLDARPGVRRRRAASTGPC